MLLIALALASPEGPAVPPPHRHAHWGEVARVDNSGTRLAMIVEAHDERVPRVEVYANGEWIELAQRWHQGRVSILTTDLRTPTDQVRFRSPDANGITQLDWDLFTPTGGEPRRTDAAPPPASGVLPAELVAIGVTSRADWDADPTTCTRTEDDWYRMAIHHTAGTQTYGGTVVGSVRALQAYALSTGEYCDIPYQFLVGYDGSLWEGRPYDYYSGATGGGNNDGNAAVCFLGCYHPSGCSTSHSVTDAMMESGQLLVQTFAALHSIPSTEDSIRGHRDWPDNATACPGDFLYDRLDELREPLEESVPSYAGAPTDLSCSPGEGARLTLAPGDTGSCTLTVQNVGQATWSPGLTNLAPIPRDVASPLAAPTWLDTRRIVSVAATTSPGANGYFSFDVLAPAAGDYTLPLGLVHEGATWFADDGGPDDGAMSVSLAVTTHPDTPSNRARPGDLMSRADVSGCGCASGTTPKGLTALGITFAFLRRATRSGISRRT
jgi:hypothetical protein